MNGDDLKRRVGLERAEARTLAKASIMGRGEQAPAPSATAADCARAAKDPLRRLKPLRRRTGGTSPQP